MPRDQWFQNGETVIDGRGNTGQAVRLWNGRDKVWYFKVRVTEGPLRDAQPTGTVWVSVSGWRGLVDYVGGTIEIRCVQCDRDFLSPLPLAPGEEFCQVCAGEPLERWLKDYPYRVAAQREIAAREMTALRRKGA